jgi:hypothetical protein
MPFIDLFFMHCAPYAHCTALCRFLSTALLASANFIIHTYPKAVVGTAIVHYTARCKN